MEVYYFLSLTGLSLLSYKCYIYIVITKMYMKANIVFGGHLSLIFDTAQIM